MALNSWQFLLLASCAIVVLPVARGWMRTGAFLGLNLIYAWSYWGVAAGPIGVAFCLAGYGCARWVQGRGTRPLVISLVLLTALFVYLRGYTFGGLSTAPVSSTGSLVAIAGLSFLFFKVVHVVVDAAAGSIERLSLAAYLNYSLNFTTLLMGPIQRYQDFAEQWSNGQASADFEANLDAANRVLRGMVKAFVLAPVVALFMLVPGLPIETLGGQLLLAKVYTFYIYLYLDFSGYCDIVIGVGSMMGVRPPENFRFPFLSRDVSAYWLRVHRSLTLWLTDYLFTPTYRFALRSPWLGRQGFLALAGSLVLTMLIVGAWHGTTLNFVVFGLVHGCALVAVRGYDQVMTRWLGRAEFRRLSERPAVTMAAVFLTYNFTSLAYVFFVLDVGEATRLFMELARSVVRVMT